MTEVMRNPAYSTGVGLLMYGVENRHAKAGRAEAGVGLIERIKRWINQF